MNIKNCDMRVRQVKMWAYFRQDLHPFYRSDASDEKDEPSGLRLTYKEERTSTL